MTCKGESNITNEHIRNNTDVRNLLVQRGIKPEELPAEEDLKKLERKVKRMRKRLQINPKGNWNEVYEKIARLKGK